MGYWFDASRRHTLLKASVSTKDVPNFAVDSLELLHFVSEVTNSEAGKQNGYPQSVGSASLVYQILQFPFQFSIRFLFPLPILYNLSC
jgi:hypothetical protein